VPILIGCGPPPSRVGRTSALVRITDSSRTSRDVRKVPRTEVAILANILVHHFQHDGHFTRHFLRPSIGVNLSITYADPSAVK
jgi:hypothetical protein